MLDVATQITIVVLLVGIAYQAGQHSNQIANLISWRTEHIEENEKKFLEHKQLIKDGIEELKYLIRTHAN